MKAQVQESVYMKLFRVWNTEIASKNLCQIPKKEGFIVNVKELLSALKTQQANAKDQINLLVIRKTIANVQYMFTDLLKSRAEKIENEAKNIKKINEELLLSLEQGFYSNLLRAFKGYSKTTNLLLDDFIPTEETDLDLGATTNGNHLGSQPSPKERGGDVNNDECEILSEEDLQPDFDDFLQPPDFLVESDDLQPRDLQPALNSNNARSMNSNQISSVPIPLDDVPINPDDLQPVTPSEDETFALNEDDLQPSLEDLSRELNNPASGSAPSCEDNSLLADTSTSAEKKSLPIEYVMVRVLKPILALVGEDFCAHGPCKKEDLLYLPKKNASILSDENVIEIMNF